MILTRTTALSFFNISLLTAVLPVVYNTVRHIKFLILEFPLYLNGT